MPFSNFFNIITTSRSSLASKFSRAFIDGTFCIDISKDKYQMKYFVETTVKRHLGIKQTYFIIENQKKVCFLGFISNRPLIIKYSVQATEKFIILQKNSKNEFIFTFTVTLASFKACSTTSSI
jgi:hypothetical protein